MRLVRSSIDLGDAAMLATVLIWATNNVIMKVYVERIGAVPYVFGRFTIVCVLLFGFLLLQRVELRVRRRDWPWFLLTGLTGFTLYNLLFTVGLENTSAFSVAVLVALGPVFTLIFASMLKIERVRGMQWAGVCCAMVGVMLIVGDKLLESEPAWGDVISIFAAMIFAIYSLATRPIVRVYGSPVVTAWSALIGLVLSLPITLMPAIEKDWSEIGRGGVLALLYSAAMSMLVAYTIWAWAIERKGVGRTVPFLYLVPVLTGTMAVMFLDERLGLFKIGGAALVLAGVAVARRPGPARPVAPAITN